MCLSHAITLTAVAPYFRSLASTGTNEFTLSVTFDRYMPTSRRQLDIAVPGAAGTISPANTASNVLTLEYQPIGVVLSSSIDPTGDRTYAADTLVVTVTYSAPVSSAAAPFVLNVETSGVPAPNYLNAFVSSVTALTATQHLHTVKFFEPVYAARVDITAMPGMSSPPNAASSNRLSFLYRPPTMTLVAPDHTHSHTLAFTALFDSPVANLDLQYFNIDIQYVEPVSNFHYEPSVRPADPEASPSVPTASWVLQLTVLPTSPAISFTNVVVSQATVTGGPASPTLGVSSSIVHQQYVLVCVETFKLPMSCGWLTARACMLLRVQVCSAVPGSRFAPFRRRARVLVSVAVHGQVLWVDTYISQRQQRRLDARVALPGRVDAGHVQE